MEQEDVKEGPAHVVGGVRKVPVAYQEYLWNCGIILSA